MRGFKSLCYVLIKAIVYYFPSFISINNKYTCHIIAPPEHVGVSLRYMGYTSIHPPPSNDLTFYIKAIPPIPFPNIKPYLYSLKHPLLTCPPKFQL